MTRCTALQYSRAALQQQIQQESVPSLNRKDQYVPARTSTYILINSCTSLYLLVPSCTVSHTALYRLVPPCTALYHMVQVSTYQYMPVRTDLGITDVSTYCLVPICGFLYGLVSTSVRTGSYQYIPSCTTLYQGYRIPDAGCQCQCHGDTDSEVDNFTGNLKPARPRAG